MRTAPAVLVALSTLSLACSGNPAPAAPAPQPAAAATTRPASAPAAATPAATATASAAAAPAAPAAAATAIDMSGSWTATLDIQGQALALEINLARGPNGYTGDAAPQGQQSAALTALTIQGNTVTMTFAAPEGEAVLSGTLAADRRSLAGQLSYQGQSLPFTMVRH